jgi:Cu(I)/Ag(I) efflux system membrane fusion protein
MTSTSTFRRLRAPLVAAIGTALFFVGILWIQHARGRWPFTAGTSVVALQGNPAPMPAAGTDAPDRVAIDVNAETLDALGVRLEVVGREALSQQVRAVATVVPDESRISHVHTRVAGWIEELLVNTTGELVRAGQPLARIFSQELFASQVEYLAARATTSAAGITSAVVAGGRTRLTVLGMTPEDIDAIEHTGEARRLVTILAPRGGVVVDRGVSVGTSVAPSTTLLTIADLSRVWIIAEVPEAHISGIRTGATARLDFPAAGRPPFTARIDFLYPTLTTQTRTLRVRFPVANGSGGLRPGLYGTAMFDLAGSSVITVPRDAVVDTGARQHVFVAIGNRFEPRVVTLGVQLADRVEIRSGLVAGDRIVASGVFLLDSESRLRATGGMAGHAHGTSPQDAPPPAAPAAVPTPAPGPGAVPAAGPHAGH